MSIWKQLFWLIISWPDYHTWNIRSQICRAKKFLHLDCHRRLRHLCSVYAPPCLVISPLCFTWLHASFEGAVLLVSISDCLW
jgi:hypothetical protein